MKAQVNFDSLGAGESIDFANPDIKDSNLVTTGTGASTISIAVAQKPKYIAHAQANYSASGDCAALFLVDVANEQVWEIGNPDNTGGISQSISYSTLVASMSSSSVTFNRVINATTVRFMTAIYY